jgi:hypothetical protein
MSDYAHGTNRLHKIMRHFRPNHDTVFSPPEILFQDGLSPHPKPLNCLAELDPRDSQQPFIRLQGAVEDLRRLGGRAGPRSGGDGRDLPLR